MKPMLTLAAGIAAPSIAFAALVGSASDAWRDTPTLHDGAVDQLYSHLLGDGNSYLAPDSNENRAAGGTTLGQLTVNGHHRLDLFDLGSQAADTSFFGVRISVGDDSYELTLTPDNKGAAPTNHYIRSINDILIAAGGTALELEGINGGTVNQTARLDFFIDNVGFGMKSYSSGIDNPDWGLTNPVFDFTPDLLGEPGPSSAVALDASDTAALAFLMSDGFEVWGFEDRPGFSNTPGYLEPDYNDRLFAFRLIAAPEPSTYGLIGAFALVAAIALRHRRTRQIHQ